MAACGSLQHIFENSLSEKPNTLLESLSTWNQMSPVKPVVDFNEMFGELHFNPGSGTDQSSSSSSFPLSSLCSSAESLSLKHESSNAVHSFKYTGGHNKRESFSSMNSESLQLCTEGLGFESSDDVEMTEEWKNQEEKVSITKHSPLTEKSRSSGGEFPPPISCIGKSGKPWVCFKSYRHDGRFVLKEIRLPSQEFLHACREDGRLKLQFVHPNDDIQELEEEEDESEEEEDDDEEEENGSIHDDREVEMGANTVKYETENDLQCRGLQV